MAVDVPRLLSNGTAPIPLLTLDQSIIILLIFVILPFFSVKLLNNQLLHVFNFLVTVVGSFAFAYKAAEYSMETPNFAVVRISVFIKSSDLIKSDIVSVLTVFISLYFSASLLGNGRGNHCVFR